MLLTKLLIFTSFVVAAAQATPTPISICGKEETCFSAPKNCHLSNCKIVISFTDDGTKIVASDFIEPEFFVIYVEDNGKRRDEVFFCFPKMTPCYRAEETPEKRIALKITEKAEVGFFNRVRGQHLYIFNKHILDAGENITYSYRKGFAGELHQEFESVPLYHMAGTKENRVAKADNSGVSVESLYEKFDAEERRILEMADGRPKRLAHQEPEVETISFNDVLATVRKPV